MTELILNALSPGPGLTRWAPILQRGSWPRFVVGPLIGPGKIAPQGSIYRGAGALLPPYFLYVSQRIYHPWISSLGHRQKEEREREREREWEIEKERELTLFRRAFHTFHWSKVRVCVCMSSTSYILHISTCFIVVSHASICTNIIHICTYTFTYTYKYAHAHTHITYNILHFTYHILHNYMLHMTRYILQFTFYILPMTH